MNTELLQFMDGSLAPEQEAELLHRLSVSPERREILRSFFNMKVLLERDRNSIAVPFAAEQKLWASLGQMMPPIAQTAIAPTATVLETAAVTASHPAFFRSVYSVASVAVVCLLIGLGSGYFAGKNSNTENIIASNPAELSPVGRTLSPSSGQSDLTPSTNNTSRSSSAKHNLSFNAAHQRTHIISGAPLDAENSVNSANTNSVNGNSPNADIAFNNSDINSSINEPLANKTLAQISSVTPKQLPADNVIQYVRDPSQFTLRSPFDIGEMDNQPQKSFLQKFEFYFNEGIGKQFPNNSATNVSMPVVTNSYISVLFQAFANTPGILSRLWTGGSFGTANVTQKKLRLDLDPIQKNYVMVGDLVHVQTTWYGGLLQYRQPLFKDVALTLTGSLGNSSVGTILGSEVAAHMGLTKDVGFVAGIRYTHVSYSIDQQQQDLINQGVGLGLSIPSNAQGNQSSYNFEISSGIYFHF